MSSTNPVPVIAGVISAALLLLLGILILGGVLDTSAAQDLPEQYSGAIDGITGSIDWYVPVGAIVVAGLILATVRSRL